MLHSAVLYSEEEGKGLEGSISFIALLIFNRSIVLVLRLFLSFCLSTFSRDRKSSKKVARF